jgi:hypothetical protein
MMSDYPEKIYAYYLFPLGYDFQIEPESEGYIEYIRADLVPTWLDMESAPKDGTPVLISDGDETRICQWKETGCDYHSRVSKYEWVWGCDVSSGCNYYDTIDHPTKWMPIPK